MIILLSSCVSIDLKLEDPESILKRSNTLVQQKRWGEANNLLKHGTKRFPQNLALKDALIQVQSDWQGTKRRLEDWILVYETEGMILQRPLLVSMVLSDPSDLLLKSRLLLLDASLNSKRERLIACAKNQSSKGLKLARRCIEAAKIINLSHQVQTLLSKIKSEQEGLKNRQSALSKAEKRSATLFQARKFLQESSYSQAVNVLSPLSEASKDDQELTVLLQEAITGRDLQVLQLINHGDRLYREEHIQEAVNIWQQAAVLDPELVDITIRVERAKKVLHQLQQLRDKQ